MRLSIHKKILISLIRFVAKVLWFFDLFAQNLIYIFLIVTYTSFLLGAYYFYKTNLLNYVAEYIFVDHEYMFVGTPDLTSMPLKRPDGTKPQISAIAAVVYDVKSGKVLYSKNADEKLAPASTTKLMTALVALDTYDLNEKIKIPADCTEIDSTKAWIPAGDEIKVRDALYAMLIGSAGDVACTLASVKIPYNLFIEKMNNKAGDINMYSSHFVNPIGLDGFKGSHYSTANDLYKLAAFAISNETVRNIVSTKEYTIKSLNSAFSTTVYNTNSLLWQIPQSIGIKTGTTAGAGEVLIYGWRDDKKELIVVVMGSFDRFYDTRALLNWTLSNYVWK